MSIRGVQYRASITVGVAVSNMLEKKPTCQILSSYYLPSLAEIDFKKYRERHILNHIKAILGSLEWSWSLETHFPPTNLGLSIPKTYLDFL